MRWVPQEVLLLLAVAAIHPVAESHRPEGHNRHKAVYYESVHCISDQSTHSKLRHHMNTGYITPILHHFMTLLQLAAAHVLSVLVPAGSKDGIPPNKPHTAIDKPAAA